MTLSLSSYIHVKKWTYKKPAQCEWLLENLPIEVKQKYHLYVENIFYIEPEAQCKLIQRNAKLRYLQNAGNLQLEMSQIKTEHLVNEELQCILYKVNLLVKKTLFSRKNSLFFVGASDIQVTV